MEPMVVSKKAPINTRYLNSILADVDFQGEISYEHLTVGRKLGSGGFKDCYAGTYKGVSSCPYSFFFVFWSGWLILRKQHVL